MSWRAVGVGEVHLFVLPFLGGDSSGGSGSITYRLEVADASALLFAIIVVPFTGSLLQTLFEDFVA